MKKIRIVLLLLIMTGVVGVSLVVVKEKVQSPFLMTFAPLFQAIGKPIKSVDRIVSRLMFLDEEDEKKLGVEIKKEYVRRSRYALAKEVATVRYLNAVMASLAKEAKKPFDYEVFLTKGSPNAYAMPGGVICITKSLLRILSSEAELVAILGHEMGHIERGHLFDASRNRILRRKMKACSGITEMLDVLQWMGGISFSKAQEEEADAYGFRMLLVKGYDPFAMSTAFEKILKGTYYAHGKSTDPGSDFFATHPYLELRIEKYRSRAKTWEKNCPKKLRYIGVRNFEEQITMLEDKYSDEWRVGPSNSPEVTKEKIL